MAVPFRSLRATLIVPFVLLVVAVALGVYWLSYNAAVRALESVSERLLDDVAHRVAQATSQHLSSASVVLNAALPDGSNRLDEVTDLALLTPNAVSAFEQRLWLASGLYAEKHRNVYFASDAGRYLGVHRGAFGNGEIRIRSRAEEPMRVYRAIGAEKRGELIREELFDPHTQAWYRAALERRVPAWSPVYRDFSTGQLLITLAKPVLRPDGGVRGVAATDVTLEQLAQVVRDVRVSDNSVIFIAEPNGNLIASSADRDLATTNNVNDPMLRLRASASSNALVRSAFASLAQTTNERSAVSNAASSSVTASTNAKVLHTSFDSELGETHASVLTYRDPAGLDLRVFVVTPHSDHSGPLHQSMARGLVLGGVAVLVALALGFWVLRRVAEDVQSVKRAAERLITGEGPITRIPEREDDIGALAHSVAAIQGALLYDRLTGALNRDAFYRQFETTIVNLPVEEKLALIFIDLDRFKRVNDRFGHSVGDAVLAKSAERIRRRLRDNDLLARFGGDEFVVMIHGAQSVRAIEAMKDRLSERLRMGMTIEEHSISVGASLGVAIYPDDGEDLDELIRVADERMYGEKRKMAVIREIRRPT